MTVAKVHNSGHSDSSLGRDDVLELLEIFIEAADEGRSGQQLVPLLSQHIRPKLGAIVEAVLGGAISPVRTGDPPDIGL